MTTGTVYRVRAVGDPRYSDVPAARPWRSLEVQAFRDGTHLIDVGNWLSFTIEKRWFPKDADPVDEVTR